MRVTILFCLISFAIFAQESDFRIGRVKYSGGSDWYNDQSAEVNLLRFVNSVTGLKVKAEYSAVDIKSNEIFSYPFLFLTGHGNIALTDEEIINLRKYLESGGFLYVDDDYGLDKAFRREIKRIFPDKELQEIPFSHKIYHTVYDFNQGPPKTHEHDNKPPQGFGIFIDDKLAVFYTYESNPSDGWADPDVHHDTPQTREEALKFGVNVVIYAISN